MKLLFILLPFVAFANPAGFQCMVGDARVASIAEHQLTIHSTQDSILHWDAFSIEAHEHTHFDTTYATLNRIKGNDPSTLHGKLTSNGALYLINPNGIVIGPKGRIDTAGFLASTLDVLDQDFLAGGELLFSSTSDKALVNLGTIHCATGDVTLLARTIQNQGTIDTPSGHTALACGTQILLKPEGSQRVFIQVAESSQLEHSGAIRALTTELKSSNLYEKAIQVAGIIEATTFEERGGEIYLVADKGICEVSDATLTGRTVHVLGEKVGVLDKTTIDVSGTNGGGTILVGGDYQGKNAEVMNAKMTFVGKETLLKADALENGNGGKVICWGDESTRHYGKISVRGGELSGDGGLAEVSGKRLDYQGRTDARAPSGKHGKLLLDPNDIVIGAVATTGSFTACPDSTYTITEGTATNQILNTDLEAQLQMCNVTISTVGSGGAGPAGGRITVSSEIGAASAWSAATTLTLIAASNISISAPITNTSAMSGFTAMAFVGNGVGAGVNNGINVTGVLTANAGDIILFGSSSNAASAGHGVQITVGGQIVTTSGDIYLAGAVPAGPTSSSVGVRIGILDGYASTSGDIYFSGTSAASGMNSYGVFHFGSSASTSGTFTYGSTINNPSGGSPASISGCQGGSGDVSHGITIQSSSITGGDIVAVNQIIGGTGTGSHGFEFRSFQSTGGNISITASTQATGPTPSHGINFTIGTMSTTGTRTITLIGSSSANNTGASNGVNLAGGAISTGSGAVSITGTAGAAAANSSNGILISTANPITSSANSSITLDGTSHATGSTCHGVSVTSSGWTTGSTADLGITGVADGGGANSFPINLGGSTTHSGNVNFNSAVGLSATSTVTGNGDATKTVRFFNTIDATAAGSQGLTASNSAGTLTYSGVVGGTTALGTFSSTANAINVANNISTSNSNLTFTGPVSLTGSSDMSTGAGAGNVSFSSTVTGNAANRNLTVDAGTGSITFSGALGTGGTPLGAVSLTTSHATGVTLGADVTANSFATTSMANLVLSAGTATIDTSAAGGAVSFGGTVNGTSAGGQSLTLDAGVGTITVDEDIGFGMNGRLNQFDATAGDFLLNANIKAAHGEIHSPVTVSGDFTVTATAID